MSIFKGVFIVFLLFNLNCVTAPPPTKTYSSSAAISIDIKLYPPFGFSKIPDRVYFMKILPGRAFTESNSIYMSNYSVGNRFYLFNADPGDYVVAAAFYTVQAMNHQNNYENTPIGKVDSLKISNRPGPSDYTIFFSEEIAKASRISTIPGTVQFIGLLKINMSINLENADNFQKTISGKIKPGGLTKGSILSIMMSQSYNYLGLLNELKNDEDTILDIRKEAFKKELRDTEWENY
jgi:hypothetical protein